MTPIPRHDITGLVLAGGRGSRMGGVDKGLQTHRGQALALHALQRLRPQVGAMLLNANRNLGHYAQFGAVVLPDTLPDHPGPLAGFLAGLGQCSTPWLLTVACDTPHFPLDLAARLADAAAREGADIAMAATPSPEGGQIRQPVFCLIHRSLQGSLSACLQSGQRKVGQWTSQHRCSLVLFEDEAAFDNINTPADLQRLQLR